jgi:hypothetical protein
VPPAPDEVAYYQADGETWAAVKSRCMGADARGLSDYVVELRFAKPENLPPNRQLYYELLFKAPDLAVKGEILSPGMAGRGTVVAQ